MAKNISRLSGRLGLKENLFEKLVDAGEKIGTPAREEISKLAKDYLLGESIVYGSASFYDFLNTSLHIKR